MAQKAGLEVAFISGRTSKEVDIRAHELGVKIVVQGSADKLSDLKKLLDEKNLELEDVAYVGDDLPDIPVLRNVGFSAAPQNATEPVKYYVHYVTRAKGGDGAVREVIDLLLKTSGKWDDIIELIGQPDAPAAG